MAQAGFDARPGDVRATRVVVVPPHEFQKEEKGSDFQCGGILYSREFAWRGLSSRDDRNAWELLGHVLEWGMENCILLGTMFLCLQTSGPSELPREAVKFLFSSIVQV